MSHLGFPATADGTREQDSSPIEWANLSQCVVGSSPMAPVESLSMSAAAAAGGAGARTDSFVDTGRRTCQVNPQASRQHCSCKE